MTVNVFFTIMVLSSMAIAQSNELPIYNGVPPGSENWTWDEKTIDVNNMTITLDVSKPTLIPYLPAKPNGTAVIIAPGGACHALAVAHEGADVAKWLNEKGVTTFVLKYRLSHDDPAHPENNFVKLLETKNFKKLDSLNAPVIPLALQDGITAVKYVRQHASEYKIDPNKIGFMGFSAGATLTMSVVYSATDDSQPNFVAPIYAYENAIIGTTVPSVKTPIFIAAASDDDLGFATHSVHIYVKWLAAKQPAELHMYEKGKHGFGTKKQDLPVDSWMERFFDWLQKQELTKKS